MKLLIRCDHPVMAAHYANVLRAAGIRCEVRNTALSGALGDIPFLEASPQIWIENRLDEPRALQLLDEARRPTEGPAWQCACGETIEPQFSQCWHCGAPRPA